MKVRNTSNYPVTVKGVRIEQGETEEVEIEDVEKYENDRRFLLEEDDEPESDDEKSKEENDDRQESSKPDKQNENKGD